MCSDEDLEKLVIDRMERRLDVYATRMLMMGTWSPIRGGVALLAKEVIRETVEILRKESIRLTPQKGSTPLLLMVATISAVGGYLVGRSL